MVYKLKVRNYLGDELAIDLTNPYDCGLAIESIDGLGPVNAEINTTQFATNDGSFFNSARLGERELTINLVFVDGDGRTIEDCRLLTYKYFPVKKDVDLWIKTENRYGKITGVVESNTPEIFSESCGCSIVILCPNSYFEDASADGFQEVTFSLIEPMFEFEFSNESLEEDLLVMSEITDNMSTTINYIGDGDIGFQMDIDIDTPPGDITVYNRTLGTSFKILDSKIEEWSGAKLKAKDKLTIITVKGMKTVTLTRDGEIIPVLGAFDFSLDWITIGKGPNEFVVRTENDVDDLTITIMYQTIFAGI